MIFLKTTEYISSVMDKFDINIEIEKIISKHSQQMREQIQRVCLKDKQYTVKKTMLSVKDTSSQSHRKQPTKKQRKKQSEYSDSESNSE